MPLHAGTVRLELVQFLLKGFQAAAAFREPAGIAFKAEITVPGFNRVHNLPTIFHDHGFIEEDNRVAGAEFIGTAEKIERIGAVVFAAGRLTALKVGGGIVKQEIGGYRSGRNKAIENVDGWIEFLLEDVGAGFELKPMLALRGAWKIRGR